jgi:hypothetical protein
MGKARRSEIGGIAVVLIFCCFGTVAQGKYSGGSGTEGEPYRISAVSDWQELMATPPDWASHFVLTADIDLNDVPITPVGNDPNWFTGVFDGNDYVIRNVDVNMPGSDYVGLFGYLGTDGQIRNLGVEDVSIVGGNLVGGLVGYSYYSIVRDCYSTGSVSGVQAVGGLVGGDERHYAISNCYSTSSVSGDLDVGGLVGVNHYSIINDSYWDIETSGEPNMCGSQEDGETNCDPNYGRTTAQMKQQSTFQGWDFINVWDIGENQTYPYLRTVPAGDINKDRIVNFLDLWIVAEEWMKGN